jgi:hypothetical protein
MNKQILDVIESLEQGLFSNIARSDIDKKNLLEIGYIDRNELIDILNKTKDSEYSSSPHHRNKSIPVNIVTTNFYGMNWYIKWYYEECTCFFISVHN